MGITDKAPVSKGVRLADAIIKYAPEDVIEGLGNRRETEAMLKLMAAPPSEDDSPRSIIGWALTGILTAADAVVKGQASKQMLSVRVQHLIADLRRGALVAVGRPHKEGADTRLVVIPAHVWGPSQIDWNRSAVTWSGTTFTDVLVARPDEVAAILEDASKSAYRPYGAPKVGRPSARHAIEQAYRDIEKDYSQRFAVHWKAIQARAMEILGAETPTGLRRDTIYKAVKPLFDAERERQNRTEKL